MASLEGHHILLLYTITCKGASGVSSKHILTLIKAFRYTFFEVHKGELFL